MKIDITEEVLKNWGVYKITNIITGDFYIGSTTESFGKRIAKHISGYWSSKLYKKKPDCPILFNSLCKYGIDSFIFTTIKVFSKKKDSVSNKRIVTYVEEKLIERYIPKYNICKKPTLSGCPNLGRKLSQEWRDNIGKKSKLYKHSSNQKIYQQKSQQNKNLSSIYRVYKEDKEFIGSMVACSNFSGINQAQLYSYIKKYKCRAGWKIEKIKTQMKGIILRKENKKSIFASFSQCDRFLSMWRGFTSTQVVNKKDKILDYNYELV